MSGAAGERIAFIGGGNIADAFIGCLVRAQQCDAADIAVGEPVEERRQLLELRYGIRAVADNAQALKGADIVVLAAKPQDAEAAVRPLSGIADGALWLSLAAGLPTALIASWFDKPPLLFRCMPNLAISLGRGASALYAPPEVPAAKIQRLLQLLATTGFVCQVPREELLDAVTAVSGTGPAYVFYLIEVLEQVGIELGLEPEKARNLVIETFYGAAVLARGKEPAQLRAQVASRGGTTEAAFETFERNGMRQSFSEGVRSAFKRARELGAANPR